MKKLVIFLSFVMILLVIGCQKEEIRPNTFYQTTTDSDDYENTLKSSGTDDGDDDNGRPDQIADPNNDDDDNDNGGLDPITDPNNDEDEDDKTKV